MTSFQSTLTVFLFSVNIFEFECFTWQEEVTPESILDNNSADHIKAAGLVRLIDVAEVKSEKVLQKKLCMTLVSRRSFVKRGVCGLSACLPGSLCGLAMSVVMALAVGCCNDHSYNHTARLI